MKKAPSKAPGKKTHYRLVILGAILGGLSFPYPACSKSLTEVEARPGANFIDIPSTTLLRHGNFQLSSRLQFAPKLEVAASPVDGSSPDTSLVFNYPYSSELLFGIEDRGEIGIQYGETFSLSAKGLLLKEDIFIPDLAFGIRGILTSQEGFLYGVESRQERRAMRGESFLAIGKKLGSHSKVALGLSILGQGDKGLATFNGGLEQYLGGGAFLSYEVFERFADFHHILGFSWNFGSHFSLVLGFTEFQSLVRQKGEWGFFLTPADPREDGYHSPGIAFSVHIRGQVPRTRRKSLLERLDTLENGNESCRQKCQTLEQDLGTLKVELNTTAQMLDSLKNRQAENERLLLENITAHLHAIRHKMGAEQTFNPEEIHDLSFKIIKAGNGASDILKKLLADSSSEIALKVQICIIMGLSRDTLYVTSLISACDHPDPTLRREVIIALGKIGDERAREILQKYAVDKDEGVSLAAKGSLKLLPNPGTKSKSEPPRK